MTIEPKELIRQYYESIKDTYPNIDFKNMDIIIRSPFNLLRTVIKSQLLPEVRFKYLGTFKVKVKKANLSLDKAYKMFQEGKILEEDWLRVKDALVTLIDREKNNKAYQRYIRASKKHHESIIHQYINVYVK